MNKEALLNVARALRESPNPTGFTMDRYMNHCGTPACALGHYASRVDLQTFIKLLNPQNFTNSAGGVYVECFDGLASAETDEQLFSDSAEVLEHFDLTEEEGEELFSEEGCGEARSALEAAAYIEQFVADAS